jgi:hypothetical protein
MAVRERVLYDALVMNLRQAIPDGIVNWSLIGPARVVAERELLADGVAYVLISDVANCYERIPHGLLAEELIELTAEDLAVEELEQLLSSVTGHSMGLPQGPPLSGTLADIYLSIADRRLVRAGHRIVRFSDDYRIAASSWRDALRAQQALEDALADIGLDINPRKTISPSRERFAAWLDEQPDELDEWSAARRDEDRATDSDGRTLEPGPYDWSPDEGPGGLEEPNPADEELLRGAVARPGYWGTAENTAQSRKVVAALRKLGPTSSGLVSDVVPIILRRFPHLTRDVCIALRRRMGTDLESAALVVIGNAVEHVQYAYDWQLGWLLHVAVPAEQQVPRALTDGSKAALRDQRLPWFVRARAALLLATESLLAIDDAYRELFLLAPTATQPDLVAAAAIVGTEEAGRLIRTANSDPLLRAVPALIAKDERLRW